MHRASRRQDLFVNGAPGQAVWASNLAHIAELGRPRTQATCRSGNLWHRISTQVQIMVCAQIEPVKDQS